MVIRTQVNLMKVLKNPPFMEWILDKNVKMGIVSEIDVFDIS